MKKVLLVVLTLCLAMVFAVGCIPDQLEQEEIPERVAPERRSVPYLLEDYVAGKNKMFNEVELRGMNVSVRVEDTSMIYTYIFDVPTYGEAEMRRSIDAIYADSDRVLTDAQEVAPDLNTLILEFEDTNGNQLDRRVFSN